MNQEQNNLNPNNFNTQGNNGIPNNQPLNNQSFNQGMGFNQQPIMQEPTPQPMNNTFERSNASNQSFNSKPPKKMNLGLIIGIVAAVAVVGVGIVFGSKLLSSGNKVDNNTSAVNDIKNGTVKLVYTSKNKIHQIENVNAYKYFETQDNNGNTIILDTNGDTILTLNGYYQYIDIKRGEGLVTLKNNYEFLGDNYILYNEVINRSYSSKVFDLQKKKVVFTYESGSTLSETLYQNGILYYYDGKASQNTLVAYDLANAKELWRYNKLGYDNLSTRIFGNYIFLDSNNYLSCGEYGRDCYASVVLDIDGNVIIEGNTDKIEYNYNLNKYDLVHTFVMNDKYYLKVKFKKYIEVYNFDNKLISNISLESSANNEYHLAKIFDEGLFTIWESNSRKYTLYDINKNIILESNSNINKVEINVPNVLLLESAYKYYLIKDGKIVEKFDEYHKGDVPSLIKGHKNSYLLLENNDVVNSKYTKQYINLKTLEKFDMPLENITERFEESPNGNYIRLSTGNDFYVYDSKFNLKYESTNLLKPINDKFVFEYTLNGDKISVVNIENGKKTQAEIKGKFQTELSSGGFVTTDGTNYYLYAFN